MTCCFGYKIVFHENRIKVVKCFINFERQNSNRLDMYGGFF